MRIMSNTGARRVELNNRSFSLFLISDSVGDEREIASSFLSSRFSACLLNNSTTLCNFGHFAGLIQTG